MHDVTNTYPHVLCVGVAYRYTDDLRALDSCRAPAFTLPSTRYAAIITPLEWSRWQSALRGHPDKEYATYIVRGLRDGFRIGFQYGTVCCQSTKSNMPSARLCEDKVAAFLASECAAGRILGQFSRDMVPMVHINRIGAVPKSTPGKYRLIVDLSYPIDHSVNTGIAEGSCSLKYVSVEEAAEAVMKLGRGAMLAKVDIRNAYRNIPVHPDDRWLLGMSWKDDSYIDTVLPFGLRSAPKIFNAVADALEWIVRSNGVQEIFHYLDDLLVVGTPGSPQCANDLATLLRWTEELGLPIASEKVEGPTTRLTFLGIEVDTEALILRLPAEKLEGLKVLISSWLRRRWCFKSELQSLAGKLQHACKVVRPGRSFLRRVFELLRGTQQDHHHIRINLSFRSDLAWWNLFLESWNGVSLLRPARLANPNHEFFADASGGFGCGAIWDSHWLQYETEWPPSFKTVAIAPKELVPIVMSCVVWGRAWKGQSVHVHSDNEAVVSVVNSGYSKDPLLMHLIRCLFFVLAAWDIASHIPGVLNVVADAISRNNLSLLFEKVPGASHSPTKIPQELAELLVISRPDWTAQSWRNLFMSCLQQV